MSLSPGTHLGTYEIFSLIGAGGMGEVYRARDTRLGRDVALKVLPPAFRTDPERLARFEREARALATLNHPNIAAIYDVEEQPGVIALVLELVEGETLAERLAQGPTRTEDALTIARQIADALDAAHERGVVHRDLKPANIKITPAGTVKVLDFGLVKAVADDGMTGELSQSPTIAATREGVIMGTPGYMSPEQARGKSVDKRTDIWSFGCVLYEMLTGRMAFQGETLSDVIVSVLEREPEWAALPAATPPDIRRLLRRCLDKDVKRRLRDIGDASFQIEELRNSAPEPSRSNAAASARWWIMSTAMAVVAAIGLGAWIYLRPAPALEPTRFVIRPPDNEQFFTGGPGFLSISPDGRRLAFVTGKSADTRRLWVRSLDVLTAQSLAGTERAWQPVWSPDSRRLAFVDSATSPGRVKSIDIAGGPALSLFDASVRSSIAWGSQGRMLFTGDDGRLFQAPETGGAPTPVTELDDARHETLHAWPIFLPDGHRFIYLAQSTDASNNGLYLASLDAPGRTRLVDVLSSVEYAPGYLLYQRDGTLMAQPFDEKAGRLIGDAVPVVEGIDYNASIGRAAFSVSATGVLAYRAGAEAAPGALARIDATGKALGTLGIAGRYTGPRLSPDGRRVAVSLTVPGARPDIWLIDLDRNVPLRLTSDADSDSGPVWSPDGTRIAFASNRKGIPDLYQRSSGGAGEDEILLESPERKAPTGFSPDGKLLLFTRTIGAGKGSDIWALPTTGDRTPFSVISTASNEGAAVFSPDGRWIAYESDDAGNTTQVYVEPYPSTGVKIRLSTTSGNGPTWGADGKTVYYMTSDWHLMAVDITITRGELHSAVPRELFEKRLVVRPSDFSVDPSGKTFLMQPRPLQEAASAITVVLNWQAGLAARTTR